MSDTNSNGGKVDIAILKEKDKRFDAFIIEMRDTHLPHIYKNINELKVQMAYYVGGGTAIVVAVQFVIAILF